MRRIFKHSIFYPILILLFASLAEGCKPARVASTQKKVAIIYPLEKDNKGQNKIDSFLQLEIGELGYSIAIKDYYLECTTHELQSERTLRLNRLIDQAKAWKPDVIILHTGHVLQTALYSNNPAFESIPTIFHAVSFPDTAKINRHPLLKGFVCSIDIGHNIKLIDSFLDKKIIGFNADTTELAQKAETVVGKYLKNSPYTLESNIGDPIQTFEQAQRRKSKTVLALPLNRMKGDSIMSVLDHFTNDNHCAYLNLYFSPLALNVSQIVNAPVFSATPEGFNAQNDVIIGGYFCEANESYKQLAQTLCKTFQGDWDKLPRYSETPLKYQFDYRLLKRWGISESALPKDSIIRNKPWQEEYKIPLLGLEITIFCAVVFILMDIRTNHRNSKIETLKAQKISYELRKLTLSITSAKSAIWSFYDDTFVLDKNLQQFLGINKSKVKAEEFKELAHPDDLPALYKDIHNTTVKNHVCTCRIKNKEKEYHWYQVRFHYEIDAQGKQRMAGILSDYQEQKDYENTLNQAKELAEKTELKQAFLANMSHEIRNPLNTIVGFSNLLCSEDGKDIPKETREEYMNIIVNNSDLLQKLLDSIMDISSIEAGAMDFTINSYPVDRLIREIYQAYSVVVRKDIAFQIEYPTTKMHVNVDKLRFTQVMDNFLSNSNKFTTKGHIKIGSSYDEARNETRIYVEDTGKGIPKEHLEKIFERYFKSEEHAVGTGLGLPLCKLIAQKMNGRIEVASTQGAGSTFTLVVPCTRKEDDHA